jgi:hypothetical protein
MTIQQGRARATVNDNRGHVAVTLDIDGGGITIILPPNKANALAAAILASVRRVSTIGDG